MSIFLGAIKSKKISRGYYEYDTKQFYGYVDQFNHINGGKFWQFTLLRKKDNQNFSTYEYFPTKKECVEAMQDYIKELEQYNV